MSNNSVALGRELFTYDENDVYQTGAAPVSWFSRTFPTFNFYLKFCWNVYRSSVKARHGKYDAGEWSRTSYQVLEALESVGVQVEVTGVEHIRQLESPCVFVGNHMSMLETIVLPSIIQPVRDVTFVVKQSLLEYPLFRHIAKARDPIAVSRDNPREDFKAVMKGGSERLEQGISIVVFPQTTRSETFDPAQFNTIGVKLALRAKVPVVPIAIITDAWGNGKWIKDLGPIDAKKRVRFAFGRPIEIEGRGDRQHQEIIDFIQAKLSQWGSSDRSGSL
jgi:1-acyl-sn-glycerol-3-phosphate acyltransferase